MLKDGLLVLKSFKTPNKTLSKYRQDIFCLILFLFAIKQKCENQNERQLKNTKKKCEENCDTVKLSSKYEMI